MRIWDLSPGYLRRASLLGEHRELHAILVIVRTGARGYAHHPETMRWRGHLGALRLRHAMLVAELRLRGYEHASPAPHHGPRGSWPERFVDPPGAQLRLLAAKYGARDAGRIRLPRSPAELWAQHKYSVLARDPVRYRELGRKVSRLPRGSPLDELALELVLLLRAPPSPGTLRNALEHMWGYLPEPRGRPPAANARLLAAIAAGSADAPYLRASTALSELAPYCEAARAGGPARGVEALPVAMGVIGAGDGPGGSSGGGTMPRAPASIDDYLATVTGDKRAALDDLRRALREIIPEAEECISYGMPAFRLRGVVVAGFQATAKGCSYYPFSGSTLATLARDLGAYDQTKSAVHFGPEQPLPTALVRKLVKARIAEATARGR